MPPKGHTPTTKLYTPYQSLGSRGVNNLAAKLLMAMFPANSPFFRYDLTEKALREMEAKGMDPNAKGAIDKAMAKYERAIQKFIEAGAYRPSTFPALKHIIVTGNGLLFIPKKGPMRFFPLDQYVCVRDASGTVIELITLEKVSPVALPDNVRALIPHHDPKTAEADVELYTWIVRTEDNWTSHQEIDDIPIPGSEGTYPLDKSPYIALRWHVIDGEDYGRGYVEDYLGDLYSLEGLQKSIVEAAAAAARVIPMVKPGSPVTLRQLARARSGQPIAGNIDDVGILQLDKYADFRVAFQSIEDITKRLSYAFLLNTAVQRPGERVTAEEIRYVAQEIESALGGTYSVLSQEMQLTFLRRIEYIMQAAGELPKLPKQFAEPTIITGVEALGRGQDLANLRGFIQVINEMGPQVTPMMVARLNVPELLTRIGAASNLDMDGLILSEDEFQANQANQQNIAAMHQLGPHVIQAAGGMAKQQIANQAAKSAPSDGQDQAPAENQ